MAKQVTDHLGNTFPSKKEMCKHWNVPVNTYKKRLEQKTVCISIKKKLKNIQSCLKSLLLSWKFPISAVEVCEK
uniref:hypothetical protein n=1 Tax=Agathobacter sp. TaxID=2021311 RepID=UPI00405777F6